VLRGRVEGQQRGAGVSGVVVGQRREVYEKGGQDLAVNYQKAF
jgi:hypothetical protein